MFKLQRVFGPNSLTQNLHRRRWQWKGRGAGLGRGGETRRKQPCDIIYANRSYNIIMWCALVMALAHISHSFMLRDEDIQRNPCSTSHPGAVLQTSPTRIGDMLSFLR